MLNRIVVMGRLTAAPQMKYTQSGIQVLSGCIACERDYADEQGKRETDFINFTAWRNTAEFIASYFGKGAMIALDGRIQSRNYTDKDGQKRTAVEINVERASFTGERRQDGAEQSAAPAQQSSRPAPASATPTQYQPQQMRMDIPQQSQTARAANRDPYGGPNVYQGQPLPSVSDFSELEEDEHVPF